MRTFAVHDAEGAISGIVTCPDDAPAPMLATPAGLVFTEIEAPQRDLSNPPDAEAFRWLARSFRVVAPGRSALLVRREDAPQGGGDYRLS